MNAALGHRWTRRASSVGISAILEAVHDANPGIYLRRSLLRVSLPHHRVRSRSTYPMMILVDANIPQRIAAKA